MDGIGRNEILNWMNDTLQLNYTKIEHTATGAAHCQLMDILFPGKINLAKVNFNAKFDYEYIKNFNYLQEVLLKIAKVEKVYMDVNNMVTGRPQANLEFCQWMKKFFDSLNPGEPYNALERRVHFRCNYEPDKALLAALGPNAPKPPPLTKPSTSKTSAAAKPAAAPARVTPTATPTPSVSKPTASITAARPSVSSRPSTTPTITKPAASTTASTPAARPSVSSRPSTTTAKPAPTTFKPSLSASSKPISPTPPGSSSGSAAATTTTTVVSTIIDPELVKELESKKQLVNDLTIEVTNLKLTIENLEKDRDFFYNKLRDVEIFCQDNSSFEGTGQEIMQLILKILYQSDEEEEEQAGEEGAEEQVEENHVQEEQLQQEEQAEEEELIEEELIDDEERQEQEIMDQLEHEELEIDDLDNDIMNDKIDDDEF